ncbi:MAG: hypothetical protein HY738_10575 [Bacteroidia bacterium]|nr:hypothetical protein [Bacteroidia bacterium]
MKTIVYLIILIGIIIIKTDAVFSQGWERTYSGINIDKGNSVQQTNDNGYIITGETNSFGAGNTDVYLIKTDANGDTLWTKTFGGSNSDEGYSVQQTYDNGYIMVGSTYSFGTGSKDVYLIKTDTNGDTLWTKTFGGTNVDAGSAVQQTIDNGYIIAGYTYSFGAGSQDVYLIKTDTDGDTLWTKTFGGTNIDLGNSVQQTYDNGYIIVGNTFSFGAGNYDVYLIKTDTNGDTLWTKTFGGTNVDVGSAVQQTIDNGFIIAGWTKKSYYAGSWEVYLIKTNADGDTLWTNTFGSAYSDYGRSIQQTNDNGFIIAGYTQNYNFAGDYDAYLIKTNSYGDTIWTRTFGGNNNDFANSVQQTSDHGFIITGGTGSFNEGDTTDIYLIKTDSLGNTITNYINGAVFIDENSNCQMDINEYSLDKCKIKVEPGPIYATPDSNGYYSVLVDTGAYIVSEILPNQLWDVFCPSGSQYTINFNQFYDTASNVNFGNNISILCPLLNITVSSSILRRCFINTYYIKYCNTGTSEASNSYIEISFPPEIIPLSSSLPWSSQTGNIYRFNIGTIDVGDCGSFYITDSVSCEAEIGQTLCVQAHIYPDSLCLPPDTVWDHSSIEVTGSCSNDSLVCFTIYNTGEAGQGDMAGTSNYRV